MRPLVLTCLVAALGGCLIGPPQVEGKICDVDTGCPAGFSCVADPGAAQGICRSRTASSSCDGEAPACELTTGVCAVSRKACAEGEWAACTAASYPSTYQPVELSCLDSLDNDCDGRLDVSWQLKTGSKAVIAFAVRSTQDGGYVVAARESVAGGSRIISYGLNAALGAAGAPTVLSTTTRVTYGPVVHARLAHTAVTWAEQSVADAGEAIWFALVDNTGALVSLDGGAELPRRAIAEWDVASTPRSAWLSADSTHLTVWTDPQKRLLTQFMDHDGRPLAAGVRPLPHTRALGDVFEAAVSERIRTVDGDGYAVAFLSTDGGADWVGLRLVTSANLDVDGVKENLPYPARNIRVGRTQTWGAGSNISWFAWVEDRPATDPVRIRTSYGADTLAEFVGNASASVKDMELVVTEDDELVVAWSDGATTRYATSPAVEGSDSVAFGAPFLFDGGMPAIAAARGSYAVFAARNAGEVWAERRCGP